MAQAFKIFGVIEWSRKRITRRCNRQPKLSLVLHKAAKQGPLLSAAERGVSCRTVTHQEVARDNFDNIYTSKHKSNR